MNVIRRLEPHVINKIAAGEVVERPASVVKELVENAIDAGATAVTVELEEGGRSKILVTDNGCGIPAGDCPLALERHATSKTSSAEDLFAIQSLGFRGEALAAISAVSRFTLRTRPPENEEGTCAQWVDDRLESTPWHGPSGTSVAVEDLFYNIPVRAKFLRSKESEYNAVLEWLQALALINPTLKITLIHNGKEKQVWYPSATPPSSESTFWGEETLRQRTISVLGTSLVNDLVYTTATSDYGQWEALISPPGVDKATSRNILHFVNGRWVKDKTLLHGVLRGYHSHLLKGRFPVVISRLVCDPSLIDVNVHPAKTEIRFQYISEVQSLVAQGIKSSLREVEWASPPLSQSPRVEEVSFERTSPSSSTYSSRSFDFTEKNSSPVFTRPSPSIDREETPFLGSRHELNPEPRALSFKTRVLSVNAKDPSSIEENIWPRVPSVITAESETIPWDELKYVGTFARCYWMFEYHKQLLWIDQHAFHERILYETWNDHKIVRESQAMVIPEEVTLEPSLLSVLKENRQALEGLGFRLQFSEQGVEVQAIPSLLANADLGKVLESLGEQGARSAWNVDASVVLHDIIATMACHGAVRAGQELSDAERQRLIQLGREVDFFHNCPHGRRVFRWLTEAQVARFFDR